MKSIIAAIIVGSLSLTAAACHQDPYPPVAYAQAPQPVYVSQGDPSAALMTGVLAGHMLSRPAYGYGYHYHAPVIVHSTPMYRFRSAPVVTYSRPSYRSSGFGSFRSRR